MLAVHCTVITVHCSLFTVNCTIAFFSTAHCTLHSHTACYTLLIAHSTHWEQVGDLATALHDQWHRLCVAYREEQKAAEQGSSQQPQEQFMDHPSWSSESEVEMSVVVPVPRGAVPREGSPSDEFDLDF